MSRDNNLGMWSRGTNNNIGGDYMSYSGLDEYTDDMSPSTMPLTPSHAVTLASLFITSFSLLSYVTPLTLLL